MPDSKLIQSHWPLAQWLPWLCTLHKILPEPSSGDEEDPNKYIMWWSNYKTSSAPNHNISLHLTNQLPRILEASLQYTQMLCISLPHPHMWVANDVRWHQWTPKEMVWCLSKRRRVWKGPRDNQPTPKKKGTTTIDKGCSMSGNWQWRCVDSAKWSVQ